MIPWWVAVIAMFGGGIIGMFLMALIVAGERDDRP